MTDAQKDLLKASGLSSPLVDQLDLAGFTMSHLWAMMTYYGPPVLRLLNDAMVNPVSAAGLPAMLEAAKAAAENNAGALVAQQVQRLKQQTVTTPRPAGPGPGAPSMPQSGNAAAVRPGG